MITGSWFQSAQTSYVILVREDVLARNQSNLTAFFLHDFTFWFDHAKSLFAVIEILCQNLTISHMNEQHWCHLGRQALVPLNSIPVKTNYETLLLLCNLERESRDALSLRGAALA